MVRILVRLDPNESQIRLSRSTRRSFSVPSRKRLFTARAIWSVKSPRSLKGTPILSGLARLAQGAEFRVCGADRFWLPR